MPQKLNAPLTGNFDEALQFASRLTSAGSRAFYSHS